MNRKTLVLLCVSVPSFMINLDANIVAVSLTSIAKSLHADFSEIEWVISAYTLAFASLVMPAGSLADRFGRKRILLTGLAIFTIASLICGAATSSDALIAARIVQGVGAALQLSAALAILSNQFQGAERAKSFAFWGAMIGIAIMLGPVAGGVITDVIGWQWAFYINIPIGLVMLVLTFYFIRESRDPEATQVDISGVLTLAGFLGLLTYTLISGNKLGWGSHYIQMSAAAAAFLLMAFIVAERLQRRPMVDLAYFLKPTFLGANIAAVGYAAAFLTMLTYLPYFFQNGLGYSAMKAGVLMLPLAAGLFIVPRLITATVEHRYSGRTLLVAGLLLVGCGLLEASMQISSRQYIRIALAMLVASVGAGVLNGQVVKVGMTVIPAERAGMASGVSGAMRFSGIVIGFAALGAVLFHGITTGVSRAMPMAPDVVQDAIVRSIGSGDFNTANSLLAQQGVPLSAAGLAIGDAVRDVMRWASGIAFVAAIAAFFLISARETAPHRGKSQSTTGLLAD